MASPSDSIDIEIYQIIDESDCDYLDENHIPPIIQQYNNTLETISEHEETLDEMQEEDEGEEEEEYFDEHMNALTDESNSILVHDVKVYKPRIRKIHPSRLKRNRQLTMFMCILLVVNLGLALCNLSYIHLLGGNYRIRLVDGNWGSWYSISECAENCIERRRYESRQCNNPPPNNNGRWCSGNVTRSLPCGTGKCRGCYPCKTPPNDLQPFHHCDCRENAPQAIDCKDLYDKGMKQTGLYRIHIIPHKSTEVYCDHGWTVFQRRLDGSENFLRSWFDYKNGFGEKSREFWLGNEFLYLLTQDKTELEITLEDWNGNIRTAYYGEFRIGDESTGYKLMISAYKGNAGDSLSYHNNNAFTTIDKDNDLINGNCAKTYHGGFWYKQCHHVNLNGKYYKKGRFGLFNVHEDGIHWRTIDQHTDSLKTTEMKLRRRID